MSPGPVLASFLAEVAGGIAGTGLTLPADGSARTDHPAGPAHTARPLSSPAETPPRPADPSSPAEPCSPASCPLSRLAQLTGDKLTGMIRGWRKQASLAQAGELAAVAELVGRRHAEAIAAGDQDSVAADAANDEVAAALTLTGRAAQQVIPLRRE